MDSRQNRSTLITVIVAVVALLLGFGAGTMAGGVAGYLIGQRAARQVPAALFQRLTPGPFAPVPQVTPRAFQPAPPTPAAPEAAPGRSGGEVIVQEVVAGSPAEAAGLRAGDVITAMDNVRLDANHTLGDLVAARRPGERVTLTVLRGGQSLTIAVTLGERADNGRGAYLGVRYVDAAASPQSTP